MPYCELKAVPVLGLPDDQWPKLHTPSAGGLGSIPGQETTSCMPTKDPTWCAAAKTWHSQINKEVKI